MSKVGEPMDLISELTDIKRRLESLEARILSLNVRLGPQLHVKTDYDFSKIKIKEKL